MTESISLCSDAIFLARFHSLPPSETTRGPLITSPLLRSFLQAGKSPFYSSFRPFPADFSSLLPISEVPSCFRQLYGVQEVTRALSPGERSDPDGSCLQMSPCTRPVCKQQHIQPAPLWSAMVGSSLPALLALPLSLT